MEKKREPWEPIRLLDTWGMRIVGGAFTDPTQKASGGEFGADDAMAACRYVESTPGFTIARPVLKWVHVEGREPKDFRVVRPGESLLAAVVRLGWQHHLGRPGKLPEAVYTDFFSALSEKCVAMPFCPLPILHESLHYLP